MTSPVTPVQKRLPKAIRDLQCSLTMPDSPRRSSRKRAQTQEPEVPAMKKRLRSKTIDLTVDSDVEKEEEESLISKPKLKMQVFNDLSSFPTSPMKASKGQTHPAAAAAAKNKKSMLMTPPTTPDKDDRKIFIKEDQLKGKKLQLSPTFSSKDSA
ncbi:hypothetical protein WICPIJ_002589 [Wickerhamomyces pijperi]|uniref:Uncharacterized protein n=1 Tax=Wickerhamomyces pijperi TaxID=599730 RepID=A0A9P8QBE8_WICPI|nr:hypothetical protein WICPIJ_002589 [Wickerhamomyces pijperi]